MNLKGKSRGNIVGMRASDENGFQETKGKWRETVGNGGNGMTHGQKYTTDKLHIIFHNT